VNWVDGSEIFIVTGFALEHPVSAPESSWILIEFFDFFCFWDQICFLKLDPFSVIDFIFNSDSSKFIAIASDLEKN
jgi:hypothetical protein